MNHTKRVVIIGGGNMGVGLLYHLAELGWQDIILLEKDELTSGSTWHAAGLCPSFIADYNMSKIHHYGNVLYPKLEQQSGQYVSWHGCGSVRFATNEHEMDYFRLVSGIADNSGANLQLIDPKKIAQLLPHVDLTGVIGGAWTPDDGHVDPAGVCNAMATMAQKMGASIQKNCCVTGVDRTADGTWRVHTAEDTYLCDHLVNAGGSYANAIAAWSGVHLPITNIKHQYFVTETCQAFVDSDIEMPVVRDPRCSAYYRQEQKSGLIGIYETRGAREAWSDTSGNPAWGSSHELFEAEYDPVLPWLEHVLNLMPIWSELGIKRVINGAIPHTPDDNPLLGPVGGLRNYWLCCGSAIGIAQGAGCGKYLAQWIVDGESEINMAGLDPRRFGLYADRDYTRAKTYQAYEHMYILHLPGQERPAGRNRRLSSLHERLGNAGAVYTEAHGWERPKWFSCDGQDESIGFRRGSTFDAIAQECRAVREQVGIMDLSSFTKYTLSGPDAPALLTRLTANRLPQVGRVVLSHMLTDNGCIESELTITRLDETTFYLLSGAGAEEKDRDMILQAVRPEEQVTLTNLTDDHGMLVIAGPEARALLARVTQDAIDPQTFRWMSYRDIRIGDVAVRALRVSYVGELGWELHMPMADLPAVYEALWAAGKESQLANFGSYALNSLRLEKAFRGLHTELTNEITLVEADMMRFFCLDKPDFVGREATVRRRESGVSIQLAYVEIEVQDADATGGEPVFSDGKCIGVVTSGGYGHHTKKSLAFVYVPPEHTVAGSQLQIKILDHLCSATVLAAPVYDPTGSKMRT